MITSDIRLEALEYVLPEKVVSSSDIEEAIAGTMSRLQLPKGLLSGLTGITERRVWPLEMRPSEAATLAAEKVIASSGINPAEIGCIINASVCRDYIEPSVSCFVHSNLKLPSSCLNFDVTNACLGFLNAIEILSMMIETGRIRYGLIVTGETSSSLLSNTVKSLQRDTATMDDYRSNFASLTLGSAGVAAIISSGEVSKSRHRLNGLVSLADTRFSGLCVGHSDSMSSDPTLIMKHGVNLAFRTWKLAQSELDRWSDDEIDVYIPHQVSYKNIEMLNETLGLNGEKQELSFQRLGNMGPASIPVTLKLAEEGGHLPRNSHVGLLGIGSGLNCAMMSLTW